MIDDTRTQSSPRAKAVSIQKEKKLFFQKKKALRYWDKTSGEKTCINLCHMTNKTEETLQNYIDWLGKQSPAVFTLIFSKTTFRIEKYHARHKDNHLQKDITAAAILETIGLYYIADKAADRPYDIYTKQQIRYAQIALKGHRKESTNNE